MRVIAGSARSIPLVAPEGNNTRPTTDRIKETLFNVIQFDIEGCVFLDLFAGSGAVGIEALSRGAKKAYFIDNSAESIKCIEANLKKTKLSDNAMVLKQDAMTALNYSVREKVDFLFVDPPYSLDMDRQTLENALKASCIDENTLIIIEELVDRDYSFAEELGYEITKTKLYKSNKHIFLKKKVKN